MGLGLAENAALTSMKVHKKAFDTVSVNVANANNEDYSVKQLNFKSNIVDNIGVGVELGPIVRKLDEFIQAELRVNYSSSGSKAAVDNYNEQVQILLGRPGLPGTISEAIDEFFNTVKISTTTPEIRLQVVQKAEALAQKISDVAYGLQKLRYDADRDLAESIDFVNQNITQLASIQQSISIISGSAADITSLLDQRDATLNNIADLIDIKVYTNENGQNFISASGGVPLFDTLQYRIDYTQVSEVSVFLENLALNDINVVPMDAPEGSNNAAMTLVKGGKQGEVVSKIKDGKIAGLLRLRDVDFPKMIDQLDNFAIMLRDKINAIHNDGSGMPPANKLTGTTSITSNEYRQFFGQARIGLTDNNGRPLTRSDGSALNALTLDLTKLDSGIGSGSLQMQTIVDEINQYFYYDPLLSTVSLGNLEDIRIASRTTNMVANGIFDFDFEVVNNSTVSSIFEVTTIDVYDNTATLVPGAVTTTLPMSMTVENGDRIRTNGISANFGAGAGGPYTLTATFKVTDIDGNVSTGIANFTIDDTPTGGPNIMNDRYVATSVAGSEITLNPPSSTVNYALAEIVDEDGLAVPTGSPGFLRIKGLRPTTGISIAELDSQEFGFTYSNGLKVPATNRRFSHFFGLNNLFVDDGTNKSVAARFEVEERISTNPNLFSIGRLARSASYVTSKIVGDETSISNLVFNANPLAGSTLTMNGQTFTFVAAATLPNHIQLGASLAATMGNITAALSGANAFTSGTVDKSTYADNGFDTLTITHRSPGTSGNYFTFSHSLIGGAQVSINSGAFLATNNGNLIGGTDKGINYTVNPNSYEISTGSSQVALDIIGASIATYTFEAAGSLPILSTTLAGYAGAIISFAAVAAKDARETYEKQQVLTDAFDQKLREGSGVNIDEEMARTVAYQNTYVASATIFSTTKRLFDVLLDSMRS